MGSRWASVVVGAILSVSLFEVPALAQHRGTSKGEKYALLIGVRRYDPNQLRSLLYSEPDVVELAATLRAQGYKSDNVVLMTQTVGAENPRFAPESSRIRKELTLLLGNVEEDDSVLIALAGHGVQFQGESASYFCPSDANLDDRKTLISLGELYKDLEGHKAGLKLLLVDACRNDPQADNSRARSTVKLESVSRPQQVQPPGGIVAMFSCSAGEKAYEHAELKHGVFFHFVIKALKDGASNSPDGELTVPDLERFVKRQVSDFVRVKYGVRQMPERLGQERGLVPLVKIYSFESLLASGKAAFARHDFGRAIADLTEAIRLDPKSADAYYYRGNAHKEKADYDFAIADYDEVIRLIPTSAVAHYTRGFSYQLKHDFGRAIADLTEAIRLDPKSSTAYFYRGYTYLEKKDLDRAIADYTKSLQFAPKHLSSFVGRGLAHYGKKAYDLAIADYDEAIRIDPNEMTIYNHRSEAYLKTGQADKAAADKLMAKKLLNKILDKFYEN